jgi:tight adherence protein B
MKFLLESSATGICAVALMHSAWSNRIPHRTMARARSMLNDMGERRRREKAFRQWPPALLFVSGAVSAGATLDDAFDHLSREAPEPLRSQVLRGARSAALTTESRILRTLADPRLRFARAALVLYLQTGGRVGRLLDTTAAVLQERVESEARVSALTAQGRVSAWIVAVTPFGLIGAMALLAPDMAAPLFTTLIGRFVLLGASVLVGLGLVLTQRMARVEN